METVEEGAIWKDICQYVINIEFKGAQSEFFEKNYKAFEETDENKLEYTDIHASYVYIIDELIEAKLSEKYT